MNSLSVSVVIPVHNGEKYIGEAVHSVLEQTRPAVECLVVNDGSSDATDDVLAAFDDAIRVLPQSQSGVSVARNRGAREAYGELVAFLDHDDVWMPSKLERQLAAMKPEHTMSVCAVEVMDAVGGPQRIQRLGAIEDLVAGMLLFDGTQMLSSSSTALIRREPFLQMGGFDPGLSMSADWDLMLRVLLDGEVDYVDEPLVRYRVHGSNMSRHVDVMERDMRRAFDKAFAHPSLPEPVRARRSEAYGRLYRMLAGSYRDAHEPVRALRAGLRALRHHPALLRDVLTSS